MIALPSGPLPLPYGKQENPSKMCPERDKSAANHAKTLSKW